MEVWWVSLIVWFGVWLPAAFKFREIAAMKGHDGGPYFWWTFWLPPVGMMMVIALPDRNTTVSISEETMKRMPQSVKTPVSAYAPSSDELPSL